MNKGKIFVRLGIALGAVLGISTLMFFSTVSHATALESDFSLQVTPSPLVTTVKPGQATELELKVRNTGTGVEELKIEPRGFKLNAGSGQVQLDDTTPPDIAQWVSFTTPTFTVRPGEWYTNHVRISLPKDAGFSYSFALAISRKSDPKPIVGGRLLKGSVAVFTLVNVDRPGSTRKLSVDKFTTSQKLYEYLPATLSLQLKNTGNSIVQPYGNIFIQRSSKDKTPISTLPVNETKGYILPGTTRTLETTWTSGFPVYQTPSAANKDDRGRLTWDWDHVSSLRIGQYTANVVAVYNDGQRDVPIVAEVTFWVIPWRAISLAIIAIVGLWFLQRWNTKRKTDKAVTRALLAAEKKKKVDHDEI